MRDDLCLKAVSRGISLSLLLRLHFSDSGKMFQLFLVMSEVAGAFYMLYILSFLPSNSLTPSQKHFRLHVIYIIDGSIDL